MIRPPRDEDFPALTAITNHYIETTAIHFGYEPLAPDYLRGLWQASTRHPWFVADQDGAAVGYAKAGVWRDRTAYDWTTEVGLYVAPDLRGRGIGRALYAALLDELARRGFRSAIAGITLPTAERAEGANHASIALHERFGFEPVGVVRDAGYKHGAWWDVGFYQKRFTTASSSPPAAR